MALTDRFPVRAQECARCGAPFWWGTTRLGTWVPIDPLPQPKGNLIVVLETQPRPVLIVAFILRGTQPPEGIERWVDHRTVCPNRLYTKGRVRKRDLAATHPVAHPVL